MKHEANAKATLRKYMPVVVISSNHALPRPAPDPARPLPSPVIKEHDVADH